MPQEHDEVKEAVQEWLKAQMKTFYSYGIMKIVDHWKKCIEKQGNHIAK